jgi:hypothetical protein
MPSNLVTPIENDLASVHVPLRLIVAYTWRSVWRILPLFDLSVGRTTELANIEVIDQAVSWAREFAEGRAVDPKAALESAQAASAIVRLLTDEVSKSDERDFQERCLSSIRVCKIAEATATSTAYAVLAQRNSDDHWRATSWNGWMIDAIHAVKSQTESSQHDCWTKAYAGLVLTAGEMTMAEMNGNRLNHEYYRQWREATDVLLSYLAPDESSVVAKLAGAGVRVSAGFLAAECDRSAEIHCLVVPWVELRNAMKGDVAKIRRLDGRSSGYVGNTIDCSDSGVFGPLWPQGTSIKWEERISHYNRKLAMVRHATGRAHRPEE